VQLAGAAATAPLWPRFGALVYEGVLLFGVVFLASWVFTVILGDATQGLKRTLHGVYLAGVVGLYFVYCWRRSGQTLPMKTWGLRLERRDGAPLRLGQAVLRYVLALAGLLGGALGFLWAFVDRDRQFLHDRLMGTRIVRAPV
jgi:uncharacterized RDD family membrane protein YckC